MKKDNLILLPKEEFEKIIFDIQGIKIKINENCSRIAIKNQAILKKRIPNDWTVDMFKRYMNGCIEIR